MSGQDRFNLAGRARRSQGTEEFFRDLKREAESEGGGGAVASDAHAPEAGAPVVSGAGDAAEVARVVEPSSGREGVAGAGPEEAVASGATARREQTRSQARTPRVSSLPRPAPPVDFEEFERRWRPHLKPKQMAVCREIFASTAALGRESYETTGRKLAAAVGVERRQITNLLIQLEEKGFIERQTVQVKKQNKGLLIRFHPIPPKFLIP